jgi:membrane protein implicated in regulation of membrane protease activity
VQEFLQALLQFPTVLFTGLLGFSVLYWLLVIVGAADLNPFDGAEGAVKGGVEGAVKGAAEGVGDGAADAVAGKASFLTEALAWLGLTKVPVTISFSLFSLFAWFIAFATRYGLDPHLPAALSAVAASLTATVGGIALTSACVRPLATVFREDEPLRSQSLVGKTVRVTTDIVDDTRGQGELKAGGLDLVLTLRAAPDVKLKYGEEAVIVEVDLQKEIYYVEPLKTLDDAFKAMEEQQKAQVPIQAGDRKGT